MGHALALSTDTVPVAQTQAAWRGWMTRLFDGLDTDLYGDPTFEGHVRSARMGEVIVTSLEANRHRVRRSAGQASAESYLKIVAPWQGTTTVEQHGRQVSIGPGGWTIYDTTCDYEIANPERSHHLILMVPKARLARSGLALASLMGRPVGGHQGMGRLALDAMRAAYRELPHLSATSAQATGAVVQDLVRLSLQELAGQLNDSVPGDLLGRIREHVSRHLRDPALTPDSIAAALGCGKRQLHTAYRSEPHTLGQDILRQRVQACMRDLADPDLAHVTITDIAFSWGFNASEHFSRVFREHAGMSPRAFRQAQGPRQVR